jgi:D-tyrosyl-tRNA(Tyr) deacylase
MRAVLQRVQRAAVHVDGQTVGSIAKGWLVLLGVAQGDTNSDAEWMAAKVLGLRAFEDEAGKMNRDVRDAEGAILVVSQFTLLADCRKGRRPSFTAAAAPAEAERLYERVCTALAGAGMAPECGVFGAYMDVELVNDGPVTFLLDSRTAV